jgi:BetI-type transcriptional repressor, C-terminal
LRAGIVVRRLGEQSFSRSRDAPRQPATRTGSPRPDRPGRDLGLCRAWLPPGDDAGHRPSLASVSGYRERIATAVGFWFDNIAVEQTERGSGFLILQAWAEADTDPAIRDMLLRRRRETVTAVALVLQEGVMRSELPSWLDVPSVGHALAALLDGVLIEASEDGAGYRRSDAERRILALIETLLAAASAEPPKRIEPVPPRAYESARAPRVPRAAS